MLHLICLCELVRRVLAVQPRTLQNRAAALQQEDAVDGIRVKCDGNAQIGLIPSVCVHIGSQIPRLRGRAEHRRHLRRDHTKVDPRNRFIE